MLLPVQRALSAPRYAGCDCTTITCGTPGSDGVLGTLVCEMHKTLAPPDVAARADAAAMSANPCSNKIAASKVTCPENGGGKLWTDEVWQPILSDCKALQPQAARTCDAERGRSC